MLDTDTVTPSFSASPTAKPAPPRPGAPPAQPATPAPVPLRFLDAFLREANIGWLLAVGSLILLCSSLMLVANHWGGYPPFWQYLIMFGYSACIERAGQFAYYRFGLRKTGTGLMLLTLLLLPALCFALGWIAQQTAVGGLAYLLLLTLTLTLAALTADRILRHLLRDRQPVFLGAFLTLSAAYALLPLLPAALPPWLLAPLWLTFLAGTIKVNRHVFWLAEQQRAPRLFGFLPLLLLGGLYFGLFAQYGMTLVTPEWFGLGCLLTALPVLLAIDALAAVFAQRSAGLIEQRPLAIVIPLLFALTLCAAGVALAVVAALAGGAAQAIVPTALLAALAFALTAWRCGSQTLVWPALAALLVAYHFLPVLADSLSSIVPATASIWRLPLGAQIVQYLPLLLLTTFAAHRLAGRTDEAALAPFVTPLRRLSGVLAALLLAAAFGDWKTLLWTATLLCAAFALQVRLLRRRWALHGALLAFAAAAAGAMPFTSQWFGWHAWWNDPAGWLLLAAAVLLAASRRLETLAATLPPVRGWLTLLPGAATLSLLLTLLVAPYYGLGVLFGAARLPLALLLLALLGAHLWRRPDWRLSVFTLLFGALAAQHHLADAGLAPLWQPLALSALAALTLIVALRGRERLLALATNTDTDTGSTGGADAMRARRRASQLCAPFAAGAALALANALMLALTVYAWPFWLAGALAGAALWTVSRRQPLMRLVTLALLNWLGLALGLTLAAPMLLGGQAAATGNSLLTLGALAGGAGLPALLPLALASLAGALGWRAVARHHEGRDELAGAIAGLQSAALAAASLASLAGSLTLPALPWPLLSCALATFALAAAAELRAAWRHRRVARVWSALALVAAAVAYLVWHGAIEVGGGWSAPVLLSLSGLAALAGSRLARRPDLAVFAQPLRQLALTLPLLAAASTLGRELLALEVPWPGGAGVLLLLTAAAYAGYGETTRQRWASVLALALGNIALALLWRHLAWSDLQLYLIPLGVSLLWLRRLLERQLPPALHTPLNTVGALIILVSPLPDVLSGSWLHLFSLLLLSVGVIIAAIGLRIRVLVYAGSAALAAALAAMVVRGGIDHPSLLWLAGLLLGAAVIALAAVAERHRERLLDRLRLLSATLQSWR